MARVCSDKTTDDRSYPETRPHIPVLLNEVIEALSPQDGEIFIAVSYTHLTLPTILLV